MGVANSSEVSPQRRNGQPWEAKKLVVVSRHGVGDCSAGEKLVVCLKDFFGHGGGGDYDGGDLAEF